MMKPVELDSDFVIPEQVLVCPECGFQGGLHHATVTIYDRAEDAETMRVTSINCDGAVMIETTASHSGNPSARRHGLAIGFWCECCSLNAELTIAQHKGTTELQWREPDSSR